MIMGDDHGCLGLLMIRMIRVLVFKMKIKDVNFQVQRHGPVYAPKRLRRACCWIFQGKISQIWFQVCERLKLVKTTPFAYFNRGHVSFSILVHLKGLPPPRVGSIQWKTQLFHIQWIFLDLGLIKTIWESTCWVLLKEKTGSKLSKNRIPIPVWDMDGNYNDYND